MEKNPIPTVEHVWSLIASGAAIDGTSNNLTLFNLIEHVTITGTRKEGAERLEVSAANPITAPLQFELVTRLRKVVPEGTTVSFQPVLIGPSGAQIDAGQTQEITVEPDIPNVRIRTTLPTITLVGSGLYFYSIRVKEAGEKDFKEVGRVPLDVKLELRN